MSLQSALSCQTVGTSQLSLLSSAEMESLIPFLNKLEKVTNTIGVDGINIPRIVVVGSQGSGKSSVLENVVGRSFLPKGTGAVTRTPLVLNLVHSPREPGPQRRQEDGTLTAEEYGVFGHADSIFTDFDEICTEIRRQTDNLAGNNRGISEEEITLDLYSPRLPNLTLVDLPGLTKVPVGDQPQDVETRIRNLVLKYIQNPSAIVMALVPANTDMATNESLKLAKDCDLFGCRTVAVLTKVDLMDAGTDATDVLEGKVVPVEQGVVAVVSRSQKDVTSKKPIAEVLMYEAEFLRQKYPSLAECNGTAYLVTTLRKLIIKHISDYLADVSNEVERKILQAEALVDFYSDDDEEIDRGLMKIITEFSSAYSQKIGASANLVTKTRVSETPIYHIIHKIFKSKLSEIKCFHTYKYMLTWIKPKEDAHQSLEELLKSPIEEMKEPSVKCAKDVCEEMIQMILKCAYGRNLLVEKFPALSNKIRVVIESFLRKKQSTAEKVILEDSFYELSRRIVDIRRFEKNSDALNTEKFQKGTAHEKSDTILKYLPSYFGTARQTVYSEVRVTIMQLLVNDVKNKVHGELVGKFSSPGTGRIFHGAEDFAEKLALERKQLEGLYQARDAIAELNDSIHCGA